MTAGELAHQRLGVSRIRDRWPEFGQARRGHLAAHSTDRAPAEKVAENILRDLFTTVLDWTAEQVRFQEDRVDMQLVRQGIAYLVVEAKRPGSLDGPGSVAAALRQAHGYAHERKVDKIAISDGCVLEAYDLVPTGLRLRVKAHLADPEAPDALWWLSTRGIYRAPDTATPTVAPPPDESLLHPKYALPARCFAFVGSVDRPATWKLPYLRLDGGVDERRLPKAIQAVISDYRGQHTSLPAERIPDVLVRLAEAAVRAGRMPHQDPTPAQAYVDLRHVLMQKGRHTDIPGIA